uniref:Cytochrome c oxidase subunit 2 n=1 Tax=Nuttallia olivacea TaxID=1125678 RepID=I6NHT7_9BIVA|nr:cytochrome c oxidase subunit II [Nuttallia olivacea]AEV94298.1 cytochrome c oxidase subunit II [Nuttallia olivacea]
MMQNLSLSESQDWESLIGLNLECLHDYLAVFMVGIVLGVGLFLMLVTLKDYVRGLSLIVSRWVYSHELTELLWTIFPMILIVILAYPSYLLLYSMGLNDGPKFVSVKVVGHQWYWSYEYTADPNWVLTTMVDESAYDLGTGGGELSDYTYAPDSSRVIGYSSYCMWPNEDSYKKAMEALRYGQVVDFPLVLPGDSEVEVLVTSADVIHCWTLNGLGVKVDAVPGRVNTVHLSNLRPGTTLWGGCSEMCGVNHWHMSTEVEVITMKDFVYWLSFMLLTEYEDEWAV